MAPLPILRQSKAPLPRLLLNTNQKQPQNHKQLVLLRYGPPLKEPLNPYGPVLRGPLPLDQPLKPLQLKKKLDVHPEVIGLVLDNDKPMTARGKV